MTYPGPGVPLWMPFGWLRGRLWLVRWDITQDSPYLTDRLDGAPERALRQCLPDMVSGPLNCASSNWIATRSAFDS
jgi:hypothetical protein